MARHSGLARTPACKRLKADTPVDLTHANSIAVLSRSIPGIADAGSLLLSVRQIGRILILDATTGSLLWQWGEGVLGAQHHASELPNGHLLVFDNYGAGKGWSRVLEVDPVSSTVVWEYQAEAEREFFSHLRGGAQRLPNGNTLITESDRGRVFEVTPEGDLVWEFLNPATRKGGRERAAIYRLTPHRRSGAPALAGALSARPPSPTLEGGGAGIRT